MVWKQRLQTVTWNIYSKWKPLSFWSVVLSWDSNKRSNVNIFSKKLLNRLSWNDLQLRTANKHYSHSKHLKAVNNFKILLTLPSIRNYCNHLNLIYPFWKALWISKLETIHIWFNKMDDCWAFEILHVLLDLKLFIFLTNVDHNSFIGLINIELIWSWHTIQM